MSLNIKNEATHALVRRFRALKPIGPSIEEIMDEMYDENGLPR